MSNQVAGLLAKMFCFLFVLAIVLFVTPQVQATYMNQIYLDESKNQIQYELKDVTLYFDNARNNSKGGLQKLTHALHYEEIHHSLPPCCLPRIPKNTNCGTKTSPNYYKICYHSGHGLYC